MISPIENSMLYSKLYFVTKVIGFIDGKEIWAVVNTTSFQRCLVMSLRSSMLRPFSIMFFSVNFVYNKLYLSAQIFIINEKDKATPGVLARLITLCTVTLALFVQAKVLILNI